MPRRPFRLRPLGLVLIALAGLAQTGCQSGFFGPCGGSPCGASPCGGSGGPCNYLKGLRERLFTRRVAPMTVGVVGGSSCCGGAAAPIGGPVISGEAPLEYAPPTVVTPGGVPSLPSTPSNLGEPSDLSPAPIPPEEKAPSAAPGPATGQTNPAGGKTSAGRLGFDPTQPRQQLSQLTGDNVSRTMVSTPEPALRSARGSVASADSEHWLENLPPLSIPRDESRNELPPPAPPAENYEVRKPTAQPDTRAETEPPAPAEVGVAPGIKRFVAVEPKLSGGSTPNTEGLDWLAEKGYKTILDLRETGQVQSSFIDEVANRGMRYVALPLGLTKVDAEHVNRFNLEISLADARPLYFCDDDGVRAGTLWFIRRVTVDGVDAAVAEREAAEIGLSDAGFQAAARSYLNGLKAAKPAPVQDPAPSTPPTENVKPAPAPAATPSTADLPDPTPAPAEPAPAPAEPAPAPSAAVQPETPSLAPALAAVINVPMPQPEAKSDAAPVAEAKSTEPAPDQAKTLPAGTITDLADPLPIESPKRGDYRDNTIWRSCAAMVVTGLGVPLAYLSRTSIPALRALRRASLPAPERQSKSLPPASGE